MTYTLISVNRLDKLGFEVHVGDMLYDLARPESAAHVAERVVSINELHRIMAHCNHNDLRGMIDRGVVTGVTLDPDSKPEPCENCIKGKATRKSFPRISILVRHDKYSKYGDKVVMDIVGP
ncbi:hypothetical protein FISHEDRAFT_10149, partial [Fistulina hepatica ATCC 64428]